MTDIITIIALVLAGLGLGWMLRPPRRSGDDGPAPGSSTDSAQVDIGEPPKPSTTIDELDDELDGVTADEIDDVIATHPDTVRPDVVSDLVAAADEHRDD